MHDALQPVGLAATALGKSGQATRQFGACPVCLKSFTTLSRFVCSAWDLDGSLLALYQA